MNDVTRLRRGTTASPKLFATDADTSEQRLQRIARAARKAAGKARYLRRYARIGALRRAGR